MNKKFNIPPSDEKNKVLIVLKFLIILNIYLIAIRFFVGFDSAFFNATVFLLPMILLMAFYLIEYKNLNRLGFTFEKLPYILLLLEIILSFVFIILKTYNFKTFCFLWMSSFIYVCFEEVIYIGYAYPLIEKQNGSRILSILICSVFLSITRATIMPYNELRGFFLNVTNAIGISLVTQSVFQTIYYKTKNIIYPINIQSIIVNLYIFF